MIVQLPNPNCLFVWGWNTHLLSIRDTIIWNCYSIVRLANWLGTCLDWHQLNSSLILRLTKRRFTSCRLQTFRGTTKMTKKFDFTPNVFALLQQRRLLISLSIERRLLKIGFDSSEDSCHSIPLSLSYCFYLSIYFYFIACIHLVYQYLSPLCVFVPLSISIYQSTSTSMFPSI